MKLFSMNQHLYSADLWDWRDTGATTPDGEPVLELYFRKKIHFSLTGEPSSPNMRVHTNDPVNLNTHLVNISDRDGELIFPADTWYRVTTIAPALNLFGKAEGYHLRIALGSLGEFDN